MEFTYFTQSAIMAILVGYYLHNLRSELKTHIVVKVLAHVYSVMYLIIYAIYFVYFKSSWIVYITYIVEIGLYGYLCLTLFKSKK